MDKQTIYTFLHIASALLLTGYTFAAFANPHPSKRKRTLIITGVLSLVMLVGGFGLKAVLYKDAGWPLWLLLKIVCWLFLAAVSGIAFRRPGMGGLLAFLTALVVTAAVALVTFGKTHLV